MAGRPAFEFDYDEVFEFRQLRHTWADIARQLRCAYNTPKGWKSTQDFD
jgi:hypothetical protein